MGRPRKPNAVARGRIDGSWRMRAIFALAALALSAPLSARQGAASSAVPPPAARSFPGETTQDYNRRIGQLLGATGRQPSNSGAGDYRIGPEDLIEVSVLEAPDLSRAVRVSDSGEISLPLLGPVMAGGLTPGELEGVLEDLLRHSYMNDPQVSVFVKEMRSHPVAVFGAVERPGVYQIREAKTLIEVLSMAQGLAGDAGDTVIVMRRGGEPAASAAAAEAPEQAGLSKKEPAAISGARVSGVKSVEIHLKDLLDSSNPEYNVPVYPGDVVKVTRAGIVYVAGGVRRPGGFLLKTNENISVLQALALAEGLTADAAGKQARIVTSSGGDGLRREIPIDLDKVLRGKAPDPVLHSRDILFIPSSSRKEAIHAVYRSAEGIAAAVSGAAVYRW